MISILITPRWLTTAYIMCSTYSIFNSGFYITLPLSYICSSAEMDTSYAYYISLLFLCLSIQQLKTQRKIHESARCVEVYSRCLVMSVDLGASLVPVKPLWQRRKLLNWLGIGLSETGSCNNVKVVKPSGIFKELSAATQGERGRRMRER